MFVYAIFDILQGTTEEIMEEVDKLEIGKSEIKGMETEDVKEADQQKQNLEGKPKELKMKEKDSQVWRENHNETMLMLYLII